MCGADFGNLGKGLFFLITVMLFALVFSVPLAIWKVIDIIRWIFN